MTITDFESVEEAIAAIDDDAAQDAIEWLAENFSGTYKAIIYLVFTARWGGPQVIDKIGKAYGITRERTQHKIKLMVNALIRERDIG